jgi:hypothetical protein
MLVKPALLGAISGKMGGLVASHNPGGTYLRRLGSVTNPATPRQEIVRTITALATNRWADTLTQGQRDAWNAYAAVNALKNRVGDIIHTSGIAWYVKLNVPRVQTALGTFLDSPPAVPGLLGGVRPTSNAVFYDVSSAVIQFDLDPGDHAYLGASASIIMSIGRQVSTGVEFYKGPYQFGGLAPATSAISAAIPNTAYVPTATTKSFVSLQAIHLDGRVGTKLSYPIIVNP